MTDNVRIARQLVKIARSLVAGFDFGFSKKFMKKQQLENPKGREIVKQDNQGAPVNVYLEYPENGLKVWYVYYITDRMKYAEVKSFGSQSQARSFIERIVTNYKNDMERKKKSRQERANFKHSYKVGDVIFSSWGYDQTNVNFYVVKEVGEKSVKIVQVSSRVVRTDRAGDEYVAPDVKHEVGKPMTKIVRPDNSIRIDSVQVGHKWTGSPVRQTSPYNWR